MSIVVNPGILKEVKNYGAFDISACFNCGNCTAVCPLSSDGAPFPRKMIRYGQLGMKEKLLSGGEPWLCYYCGECSQTCPRQAEPGEYMASLRRYATANYEPSGIARLFYTHTWAALLITLLLAAVLGVFMVSLRPGRLYPDWLFTLVPYEAIHQVGIAVSILFALLMVWGTVRFLIMAERHYGLKPLILNAPVLLKGIGKTLREILTMKRHRPEENDIPLHKSSWWAHMTIMWGFLGLFGATLLDFLFVYFLGWPIFIPARILGTISGLVMIYGVTLSILRRLGKKEKNVSHSLLADWWLLVVLFLLAVTGFWIEMVVTLKAHGLTHDIVLLIHTILAMELILLMAATKLAHVVYRPMALFFHNIAKERK